MADYDENNKGTLSREHFRKKLSGLTFPLTFNSKRKAMLSAIYTIRAEEPNSVIVSASIATQEYRFLVKSINHESRTDPEAYPDSDALGRSIPKEKFKLTASVDLIKVRTVLKKYSQEPEDKFGMSANLVAIKVRSLIKDISQKYTFTLTASIDNIILRSIGIDHPQPLEDTYFLTSKVEQAKSVKAVINYPDSTETHANNTTVIIEVPSAAKAGDVLIAVLVTSFNPYVTSPDWVNEFSASPSNTVRIFTKVWDGTETSYTFTLDYDSRWSVYCYIAEEYIKHDYTVQNTRNYTPSTGNEIRVIGYDDEFKLTKYTSKEVSLVTPSGGTRTGFTKHIHREVFSNYGITRDTLYLAGTVTKLPITSLDPIGIEIEYPNQNITKQFMVILETRKVNIVLPPTNIRWAYSDS